jgi:hypothetical protein
MGIGLGDVQLLIRLREAGCLPDRAVIEIGAPAGFQQRAG